MEGIQLLFTILAVLLLGAYLYFLWRRHRNLLKTILLSLSLVILESSLWHVFFGEQFAAEQCEGVDPQAVFGFAKCAKWNYDFLFDSYEITVSLSISIMAGLMFVYVPPKHILQFTMLCLLIALSLLLLFLPYQNAKEYAMPYNAIAALLSLTIVIDEIYDSFGEETIYEQVIEEEMVEQSRA